MTERSEYEILDEMKNAILEAMDSCKTLATSWRKGQPYDRLRKHLQIIEDDCRIVGGFRLDQRWLDIGMQMGMAHKYAGGWLRGYTVPGGPNGKHLRVHWEPGKLNQMFVMLGMNLGQLYESVERLAVAKTGTMNPIVQPLPSERTVTRVNGYDASEGGILLPRAN